MEDKEQLNLTLSRQQVEDKIKEEVESYRKFAFKQSLLQTAILFMVCTQLNKMLMAFTESFVMPCIKFVIGGPEESWRNLKWEPIKGLAFEVGKWCGASVDFVIISFVLYIIWVKILKQPPQPEDKK